MSQGSDGRPLPSWLAELAASQATGSLVATAGDATREVLLTNGEIRAARSHVESEKLGMWLVERGRISEDDRALNLLAQGGGVSPPLGHILVTRGCLSAGDLEEELEELALTIIRRAAAARGLHCSFVDGGGAGQLDTLPNVITQQIILMAAREITDVDAIRREIGPPETRLRLADAFKTLLEEVELTPTEGFVLSRLDAARDVSGLTRLMSLPENQLLTTLYTLMLSGTVEVEGGPRPETDASFTEGDRSQPAAEPSPQAEQAQSASGDDGVFSQRQIEERKFIRKLSDGVTKVDHYKALGLKPDANPAEIADSWKKTQERFAPGGGPPPHLKDMVTHLERIVERGRVAYEILSDFKARERYDRILKSLEKERATIDSTKRGEVDPQARKSLVEANLKRADELIRDREFYLAIQLLERACALDPRPDELLKLARLLQRNPLWTNRALACLRRAIETDPKHIDSWLELADFWRRRNHAERQRKSLERALAVDPDNEIATRMYRDLVGAKELQRLLKRARQIR